MNGWQGFRTSVCSNLHHCPQFNEIRLLDVWNTQTAHIPYSTYNRCNYSDMLACFTAHNLSQSNTEKRVQNMFCLRYRGHERVPTNQKSWMTVVFSSNLSQTITSSSYNIHSLIAAGSQKIVLQTQTVPHCRLQSIRDMNLITENHNYSCIHVNTEPDLCTSAGQLHYPSKRDSIGLAW